MDDYTHVSKGTNIEMPVRQIKPRRGKSANRKQILFPLMKIIDIHSSGKEMIDHEHAAGTQGDIFKTGIYNRLRLQLKRKGRAFVYVGVLLEWHRQHMQNDSESAVAIGQHPSGKFKRGETAAREHSSKALLAMVRSGIVIIEGLNDRQN